MKPMNPHSLPELSGDLRAASDARFVIAVTRWNPRIVQPLLDAAMKTLRSHGVQENNIRVLRVPGAWELPSAVQQLLQREAYAAVIALGCVVRGETRHYEHVADECARGLMRVSLDTGVPVANGVLAVERFADAEARAGGAHGNKGEEAALAALEMADLNQKIRELQ
jgi:6,7-dimethyl-8-ribityllumazine synthase